MKKLLTIKNISRLLRCCLVALFMWCTLPLVHGQFQSIIGLSHPVYERGISGVLDPSGNFVILGHNFNHPNALDPSGDLQLVWLNNSGAFAANTKILGIQLTEQAAWIENTVCNASNRYIVTGTDQDDILLALLDLSGFPVWTKKIGRPNMVESGACVKRDATGNHVVLGNQIDPASGISSVHISKINCAGNSLWVNVYTLNGYSLTATSITTFATFQSICPAMFSPNTYFATGRALPLAGGNEVVFILAIDVNTGAIQYFKIYDIAPGADDIATTIQGSCAFDQLGELWISGYSIDNNVPSTQVLMMKTDFSGNPLWANNYDRANGDEFATHFVFDSNNKIVVTGKAEENVVFQGTKSGNCMLMRMDAGGSIIDWGYTYTNNDFSSQGNRVIAAPNNEYYIAGQTLELLSPSQSSTNILAIKTDQQGQTTSNCFNSDTIIISGRIPVVGTPMLNLQDNPPPNNSGLDIVTITDQSSPACAPPPCPADFTWVTSNCFDVTFTGTSSSNIPGNYTFIWDIGCDNNPEYTQNVLSNTSSVNHTFPCGGGVFNVCLTVIDPTGCASNQVMHTVTVPSTCCGQVNATSITCGSALNEYNYSVTVSNPLGSTACACTVSAGTGVALGPYTCTSTPTTITVTGTAIFTTPVVPLSLNLSVQTSCICPGTNLPYTCTLPVSIPTICCKTIAVADHIVCKDDAAYDVPIQVTNWPPLNNISQVSWYVLPKPANGICPNYWGGTPYQDNLTNVLEPLHLNPQTLKTDLCVYVVVHLNDGPCTMLTSNIAMVTLCAPSTCDVAGIDTCFTGTPIVPGLLTLNLNSPANACPPTIDWYDPNGMLVHTGTTPYQPTLALSMANPANCYEDFFYTVRITDECGQRDCQARIRLYSSTAAVGTLAMDPLESQPFCPGEDATLKFTPACAGAPPKWTWHFRDCVGGPSSPIQGTGMMNPTFNTNKLYQSGWYIVEASNGVCPPNRVEYKIEVKDPLAIVNFTAVPDPCVELYVDLSVDFTPCTIQGCGTSCSCTYTVEWYLNGFLIGSTQTSLPTATFTWNGTPLTGNYYAVVKDDCCLNNTATTWPIAIEPSCVPVILGPCFICDNDPVTLMAQMVVPPNKPCTDPCTFTWYDAVFDLLSNQWIQGSVIGSGPTLTVTTGGYYFLESNCNGCIKTAQFHLLPCQSGQLVADAECGVVSVEELLPKEETPIRLYPNPATGNITVEWLGQQPLDTRLILINSTGAVLRNIDVPDQSGLMLIDLAELPAGMYFVKIESAGGQLNVAKIVKN
ncbi:MAG: T9SS type A sorting domain-containing protein [Saprospiraceae bacterium]|nr:T9SS type A sorting domain-containing protein [Saprospiraceae bacterium]